MDAGRTKSTIFSLKANPINRGIGQDIDVVPMIPFRDEIRSSRPQPLMVSSDDVAAPMRHVSRGEHVMVQGKALRLKRFKQLL